MKERFNRTHMSFLAKTGGLQGLDDRDEEILEVEGFVFWLSRLSMNKLHINILVFLVSEVGLEVLMRPVIVIDFGVTQLLDGLINSVLHCFLSVHHFPADHFRSNYILSPSAIMR